MSPKSDAELAVMPLSLRVAWIEAMARGELIDATNRQLKDALRSEA
jgi:hypothetical protein